MDNDLRRVTASARQALHEHLNKEGDLLRREIYNLGKDIVRLEEELGEERGKRREAEEAWNRGKNAMEHAAISLNVEREWRRALQEKYNDCSTFGELKAHGR